MFLRVDSRWRVAYLLSVALGIFFLRAPWQVAIVVATQAALWIAVGIEPRRLLRQVTKLWGFALFILLSYALTKDDPDTDRFLPLHVLRWTLTINVTGARTGLVMVLRVLGVVLASHVSRAGDTRAIAHGLGRLG